MRLDHPRRDRGDTGIGRVESVLLAAFQKSVKAGARQCQLDFQSEVSIEPDFAANGPAIRVGVAPSLNGAHNNGLLCGVGGAHRGPRGETKPNSDTISRF
jgi:hypothetical protein